MQNHNFSCGLGSYHAHACKALVTPSVTARFVRRLITHTTCKTMFYRRGFLKVIQSIWSRLLIMMISCSFDVVSVLMIHVILVSRGGNVKLKLTQI